jgi:hypothetical protein
VLRIAVALLEIVATAEKNGLKIAIVNDQDKVINEIVLA